MSFSTLLTISCLLTHLLNSKHFFACVSITLPLFLKNYILPLDEENKKGYCMELRAISTVLTSQGLSMGVICYFDNLACMKGYKK